MGKVNTLNLLINKVLLIPMNIYKEMILLIHSFEIFIPVSDENMYQLFSKYGIKVNKYRYISAAIKQLNKKLKKVFPAYAIVRTWEDKQLPGKWYLKFKVDAIKVLKRSLRDLESIGVNPILIPKNFSTENYSTFPSFMKNPFKI